MSATCQAPPEVTGPALGGTRKGSLLVGWPSSTDHKVIGHLYLITSFGFFLVAELLVLVSIEAGLLLAALRPGRTRRLISRCP